MDSTSIRPSFIMQKINERGYEDMEIIEPYGFIYITTNMVNGKKYIGQRKFKSKKSWQSYLGSGAIFRKALKKYGKENFHRDIVAIAYSKSELNDLEIDFIKNHNAVKSNDYYNIATGGSNGNNFAGKTKEEMEEIANKISKTHKGKVFSCEHKNKISKAHKGKKWWNSAEEHPFYGRRHTKETKEKMSQIHKKSCLRGKDNPMYGVSPKERMDENTYNQWKLKIGIANTGKHHTEKTKDKMRGKNSPHAKEVFVYDCNMTLQKYFLCYKDCSMWMIEMGLCKNEGTARDRIRKNIRNHKTYKGYYFREEGDVLCQSA